MWQDRLSVVRGIGGVVGHRAVVVDETHKTGILDPFALGFRNGKDHPLGNRVILAKENLVIGLCQPHRHINGICFLLWQELAVVLELGDLSPQIIEGEVVRQLVEELVRDRITCSHFLEFELEQVPVVAWIGMDLWSVYVVAQGIEVDIVVTVDNPAAKFDGGDVAFTGGTEAHNEPARAFGIRFLVCNLHDRGVEKCRRFHRVFRSKVSANQQSPLLGHVVDIRHKAGHPFKIPLQALPEVAVTVGEIVQDGFQ